MAAALKSRPGAPARVIVVWEPVIWTDAFRPAGRVLAAKIPDERAVHYWDPKKSLSVEILRSPWTRKYPVSGGPTSTVWDWVACYPRGARWGENFPEPDKQWSPVVDEKDRLKACIDR